VLPTEVSALYTPLLCLIWNESRISVLLNRDPSLSLFSAPFHSLDAPRGSII